MRFHTNERKYKANSEGVFYFESPTDSSSVVVIFPTTKDGLMVAVSETHAVDSYNEEFECSLHMQKEQAILLRDLLNEWFPRASQ